MRNKKKIDVFQDAREFGLLHESVWAWVEGEPMIGVNTFGGEPAYLRPKDARAFAAWLETLADLIDAAKEEPCQTN